MNYIAYLQQGPNDLQKHALPGPVARLRMAQMQGLDQLRLAIEEGLQPLYTKTVAVYLPVGEYPMGNTTFITYVYAGNSDEVDLPKVALPSPDLALPASAGLALTGLPGLGEFAINEAFGV